MKCFHHTLLFTLLLGLVLASASLAGEADELDRRFAQQLDRSVELQLSALVSQKLAGAVEAIRIPAASPRSKYGELAAARLECKAGPGAAVDCNVAQDPTRGTPVTSLAVKR